MYLPEKITFTNSLRVIYVGPKWLRSGEWNVGASHVSHLQAWPFKLCPLTIQFFLPFAMTLIRWWENKTKEGCPTHTGFCMNEGGKKKPTKNCYFVKPLRVSGFICYRSVTWYSLTKRSTDRLVTKTNNKKNAVPLADLSSLSSLIPQLLLSRSFGLWWPCFYVWFYF